MAESRAQERLLPSLLDRLIDEAPKHKQESRDQAHMSLRRLREAVVRDLTWLFNATNLAEDLDDFPEVRRSVLNYGMPHFTGFTASGMELPVLERLIRQVIWDFEPRLLRNTVAVRALIGESRLDHNSIAFQITGQLWSEPMPENIYLKTEVDLESGDVTVSEYAGGRDD